MMNPSSGCFRKLIIAVILGSFALCILLMSLSFTSNLILPSHSENTTLLSDLDKARLSEAIHLRQTLGERVWPGWGSTDIPTIVYNEEYAFLVGLPDPATGWIKVPSGEQMGVAWEEVPGDTFEGRPYFRQRLTSDQMTPQAFTVLVGDRWVASMTTKEWTEIGLAEPIRESLPPLLREILPYRLYSRLLVGNSDRYITLMMHEAFHAYQGQVAAARLEQAEEAGYQAGTDYPWDDPDLEAAWKLELGYLTDALRSTSQAETTSLVRQFLEQRRARRTDQGLSPAMIDYENLREWEEGLSKYAELDIWRQASSMPGYQPDPAIASDKDFKNYASFEKRWREEIALIDNDAEDTRFYYTGMAQAFLLDRLMPAWKERALEELVLEDLLQEAVR